MLIKICGVLDLDSAQVALNAGADFVGFIFVPNTKRYIDPRDAKKIIDQIQGKVKTVGVFRDQEIDQVNNIAQSLNLDFVQLHGLETSEYINQISKPVIKAFNINEKVNIDNLKTEMKKMNVKYFLLDRAKIGEGARIDINLVNELAQEFPILLSGGLTPENIDDIKVNINILGLDVSSGVETDGKKDHKKIQEFIRKAKNG